MDEEDPSSFSMTVDELAVEVPSALVVVDEVSVVTAPSESAEETLTVSEEELPSELVVVVVEVVDPSWLVVVSDVVSDVEPS